MSLMSPMATVGWASSALSAVGVFVMGMMFSLLTRMDWPRGLHVSVEAGAGAGWLVGDVV